jgi:hypothetical protein
VRAAESFPTPGFWISGFSLCAEQRPQRFHLPVPRRQNLRRDPSRATVPDRQRLLPNRPRSTPPSRGTGLELLKLSLKYRSRVLPHGEEVPDCVACFQWRDHQDKPKNSLSKTTSKYIYDQNSKDFD